MNPPRSSSSVSGQRRPRGRKVRKREKVSNIEGQAAWIEEVCYDMFILRG